MPRIPWTTPAQDKFLQGHGSTFLQKQEAGTLEGWFPSLYELYFAEWPEADPDVEVEVKLRGKLVMQTNLQVRKSVSGCSSTMHYDSPASREFTIGSTITVNQLRPGGFSASGTSLEFFSPTRLTNASVEPS